MVLIDSHCHLNYDYGAKTAADLVREAGLAGVDTLMAIATDVPTLPQVVAVSEAFPNVFHSAGIHPHEAAAATDEHLLELEKFARHPKCKAVGEIGLDFYYNLSSHEVQIQRFEQQLEVARQVGLPVVIHCREAEKQLLSQIQAYCRGLSAGAVPGVIHCFTGSIEFGKACLELGFYISFSGILTFKTAETLREAARAFPLDRLLVETDAPYLAPMPFRGKKCEPAMVVSTAQKLAETKGVSFEEVCAATRENTIRCFGLDPAAKT
ncbi:TatD family hydrolase [Bdellovibrionota bacterium FG-2]